MALLTIPSISRTVSATVSLNKTDLFALSQVSSDSYFSIQTNVQFCVVQYSSSPGNETITLKFDLSQATPTASVLLSSTARGNFYIQRLVLRDYDNGFLVVDRSQLPSGFDIVVTPSGDPQTVFLAHLDGSFLDSSVSGLTPTAVGSPSFVTGRFTQAAEFPTVSQRVTYPTASECNFGTGDFTIECWLKARPGVVLQGTAIAIGTTSESNNGYGLPTKHWALRLSDPQGGENGLINFEFDASPFANFTQVKVTTRQIFDENWHHFAVVSYSGVITAYIDGVSKASVANATTIGKSNTAINIGNRPFVDGRGYQSQYALNGIIDEIRISKGIARYTSNFTPPSAPLN